MRRCIACGQPLPEEPIFELEHAPASAQDIPDSRQLENDHGILLALHRCMCCGLVQLDCEPVSYYKDVIRAGGFSTTMTELRRRQYRHLIETYQLQGRRFLEAGCGRGEFLKVLTEFPVEACGIEHKAELAAIAREQGLNVWQDFAGDPQQKLEGGPYDVFLSFNFLEHQPEPGKMLQALYNNLTDDGMGLVTVPALEYILEKGSYYELIRDHIAYYTFDSLRALLNRWGFTVLEEEMINRDTISMIVKKDAGWNPEAAEKLAAERWAAEAKAEANANAAAQTKTQAAAVDMTPVKAGFARVCKEMQELTEKLSAQGKRLAIWGASHQGFTLASTAGIAGQITYIIDSAPFKQGRFAPASHLPIVAPEHFFEEPADTILIVAPGYTEEIAGIIRQRFGAQVEILTLRSNRTERIEEP